MKFTIDRTSCNCTDTPPCEEAQQEDYVYTDQRKITYDRFHFSLQENWFQFGFGHGENETGAFRLLNRKRWVIEINTLEELIAFQKKYGELVLQDGEIEIYDDYRE